MTTVRCVCRRFLLASLLAASITDAVIAQEEPEFCRSAIYLEGLGQGLLYSVNYDYRFTPHLGVRAGFSSWSIEPFFLLSTGDFQFTGFPIMLNYLTGDWTSHLELGIGIVPAIFSIQGREIFFGTEYEGDGSAVVGTATIGYRAQPRDGGFVFRIGFTPLFTFKEVQLWGGLSLGVAF